MSTFDPRKLGARCDACPRRGCKPVPSNGDPAKARVIWLGQDPGKQEVAQGRPFVGPTGMRTEHIWERAFASLNLPPIPRQEIYVVNAASCMPITKKESEAKLAMKACRPRALREMISVRDDHGDGPDLLILGMGKWALHCLTGEVTGMGKYQGFHIPVDLDSALLEAEETASSLKQSDKDPDEDIPF